MRMSAFQEMNYRENREKEQVERQVVKYFENIRSIFSWNFTWTNGFDE